MTGAGLTRLRRMGGDGTGRGRRKWVRHSLSNPVVYGGLFFGATRLPMPVLQAINLTGNTVALLLLRKTRLDVAANFRTALGVPEREARRLARRLFYEYGRVTIDAWRCRTGAPELAPRIESFAGDRDVLAAACRDGRGCLLVTAHVGSWEMGAVALRAHGLRAVVVGQPELDPTVQRMREEVRRRLGVEAIEIGASMATALKVRAAVESGAVVAVLADRSYPEDRVTVPFFGRPAEFLRSPARLARFCGCPVLPGFFLRRPGGSYTSSWGPLLLPDREAPAEADAERLMAGVARATEAAVRAAPVQWFNFYRYWGEVG